VNAAKRMDKNENDQQQTVERYLFDNTYSMTLGAGCEEDVQSGSAGQEVVRVMGSGGERREERER
jgi:hypothetical protein